MNILLIGNAFPPTYMGGESLHLHLLATGLVAHGHKLTVVHPCQTRESRETVSLRKVEDRLDVFRIDMPERVDLGRMNRISLDLLKGLVDKGERFDLIHCHSNRFYDGVAAFTTRYPAPVVTTVHAVHTAMIYDLMLKKGMTPDLDEWAPLLQERKRQSNLCARSDRVIAISKAMSSHIVRYFDAEPSKVKVIYNGIDANHLSGMKNPLACKQIRKDLHLGDRVVVLYAGRIEPVKGIGPLAEACGRICRRHDQVAFLFLGNGSADGWLRSRLRNYRQVHFVDWLDSDGVVPYYHLADVAVVPSLIEPFGLVPLEAMACSTCVLCSNADGMDETVLHEESGFKIPLVIDPHGDRRIRPEDIVNGLERAILDPAWRMRLAEGGVRRAAEFTVERMVRETEKVYSELLGKTIPNLRDDRVTAEGSFDLALEEHGVYP